MLRQTLVENRVRDEGETQTTTRRIETEPGIRSGFEGWLHDWRAWAATELENEPVREIYRWLFQMSEQAGAPDERDEVRRHVLTVPVQMNFDDHKYPQYDPMATIVPGETGF